MKAVRALTPDERTIVARVFTVRATRVEGHSTDTAVVVVGDPFPDGHARVAKREERSTDGRLAVVNLSCDRSSCGVRIATVTVWLRSRSDYGCGYSLSWLTF